MPGVPARLSAVVGAVLVILLHWAGRVVGDEGVAALEGEDELRVGGHGLLRQFTRGGVVRRRVGQVTLCARRQPPGAGP